MAKKASRKQGAVKPKRASSVRDLSAGTRRGDKAGSVKGGVKRRPNCITF